MSDHSRVVLEQVAADLDRLLCARSLTQKAAYQAAGIGENTLNRLLRAHDARVTTLVRLAESLGCEVRVTFHVKRD